MSISSSVLVVMVLACVFTRKIQAGLASEKGGLGSKQGCQMGRESVLIIEGNCECGVPLG